MALEVGDAVGMGVADRVGVALGDDAVWLGCGVPAPVGSGLPGADLEVGGGGASDPVGA